MYICIYIRYIGPAGASMASLGPPGSMPPGSTALENTAAFGNDVIYVYMYNIIFEYIILCYIILYYVSKSIHLSLYISLYLSLSLSIYIYIYQYIGGPGGAAPPGSMGGGQPWQSMPCGPGVYIYIYIYLLMMMIMKQIMIMTNYSNDI